MNKLTRQLLDLWRFVPAGFHPDRAFDLTRSFGAREFHYRHPDGRLHVVRVRNGSGEKMLDRTVPQARPWGPPARVRRVALRGHLVVIGAVAPDHQRQGRRPLGRITR